MKLAQFQVQLNDDHKFDDTIFKFQKHIGDPDPESIHTELLFDDGKMFSSSGRGGFFAGHGLWPGVGTRFIDCSSIEPHKWKMYPLIISEVDESLIRASCEVLKPMAYDWLGIIGQPLPFNIQLGFMAYCSEIVNERICAIKKEIKNKRKIRPGEIVDWYKKIGLIT